MASTNIVDAIIRVGAELDGKKNAQLKATLEKQFGSIDWGFSTKGAEQKAKEITKVLNGFFEKNGLDIIDVDSVSKSGVNEYLDNIYKRIVAIKDLQVGGSGSATGVVGAGVKNDIDRLQKLKNTIKDIKDYASDKKSGELTDAASVAAINKLLDGYVQAKKAKDDFVNNNGDKKSLEYLQLEQAYLTSIVKLQKAYTSGSDNTYKSTGSYNAKLGKAGPNTKGSSLFDIFDTSFSDNFQSALKEAEGLVAGFQATIESGASQSSSKVVTTVQADAQKIKQSIVSDIKLLKSLNDKLDSTSDSKAQASYEQQIDKVYNKYSSISEQAEHAFNTMYDHFEETGKVSAKHFNALIETMQQYQSVAKDTAESADEVHEKVDAQTGKTATITTSPAKTDTSVVNKFNQYASSLATATDIDASSLDKVKEYQIQLDLLYKNLQELHSQQQIQDADFDEATANYQSASNMIDKYVDSFQQLSTLGSKVSGIKQLTSALGDKKFVSDEDKKNAQEALAVLAEYERFLKSDLSDFSTSAKVQKDELAQIAEMSAKLKNVQSKPDVSAQEDIQNRLIKERNELLAKQKQLQSELNELRQQAQSAKGTQYTDQQVRDLVAEMTKKDLEIKKIQKQLETTKTKLAEAKKTVQATEVTDKDTATKGSTKATGTKQKSTKTSATSDNGVAKSNVVGTGVQTLNAEVANAQELEKAVKNVTAAVNAKTEAFKNEQNVVAQVVQGELQQLAQVPETLAKIKEMATQTTTVTKPAEQNTIENEWSTSGNNQVIKVIQEQLTQWSNLSTSLIQTITANQNVLDESVTSVIQSLRGIVTEADNVQNIFRAMSGVQQNDFVKNIREWSEADDVIRINSIRNAGTRERFAYVNTQTGDMSNSHIYDGYDSISKNILNALNSLYNVSEKFNATIHSHPIEDVAVPSDADFQVYATFFNSMKEHFVSARNEIAHIDFSNVTDAQYIKDFANVYKQKADELEDQFNHTSLKDAGIDLKSSSFIDNIMPSLQSSVTVAFKQISQEVGMSTDELTKRFVDNFRQNATNKFSSTSFDSTTMLSEFSDVFDNLVKESLQQLKSSVNIDDNFIKRANNIVGLGTQEYVDMYSGVANAVQNKLKEVMTATLKQFSDIKVETLSQEDFAKQYGTKALSSVSSVTREGFDESHVTTLKQLINSITPDVKSAVDGSITEVQRLKSAISEVTNSINGQSATTGMLPTSTNTTGVVDNSIANELQYLEKLQSQLTLVIEAIDKKTQAFKEESSVVDAVVAQELQSLEQLENKIKAIQTAFDSLVSDKGLGNNSNIESLFDADKATNVVKQFGEFISQLQQIVGNAIQNKTDDSQIATQNEQVANIELPQLTALAQESTVNNILTVLTDLIGKVKIVANKESKKATHQEKDDNNKTNSNTSTNSQTKSSANKQQKAYGTDRVKNIGGRYQSTAHTLSELGIADAPNVINILDEYRQAYDKVTSAQKEFVAREDLSTKTGKNKVAQFEAASKELDFYEQKLQNVISATRQFNASSTQKYKTSDVEDALQKYATENNLTATKTPVIGADLSTATQQFETIDGKLVTLKARLSEAGDQAEVFVNKINTPKSGFTKFIDTVKVKIQSLAAYFISAISIYDVWNALKSGISTVKDIESALAQLEIVTGESKETLQSFADTAVDAAKKVGASVTELLASVETWSRLGYSLQDATNLAKTTAAFSNVAATDVDSATTSLTSILKGFQLDAGEIENVTDMLTVVGAKYAISAGELGEALQRGGAALNTAGNTLEESIGLATAANASIQNAETVGNTLKTVALRVRGATSELKEAGEDVDEYVVSTSKMRDTILANTNNQVDILEEDGQSFKSTAKIFEEIANVYEKLPDLQKAALTEALGGKRGASVVSSILLNVKDLTGSIEDAQNATGATAKANEIYLDTIDGRLKVLKTSVANMWKDTLDSSAIKFVVNLANGIVNIADKLGTIPSLLSAIAGGMSLIKKQNFFTGMFSNESGVFGKLKADASSGKTFSDFFKQYSTGKTQDTTTDSSAEVAANNAITESIKQQTKAKIAGAEASKQKATAEAVSSNASHGAAAGENLYTGSLVKTAVAATAAKVAVMALNAVKAMAGAALQMAAVFAITKGIELIVSGLNNLRKKIAPTQKELQETWEQNVSDIQKVNKQLDETSKKITELQNKGVLSFVDKQELNDLVATNEELERQKRLLEANNAVTQDQLAQRQQAKFDTTYEDHTVSEEHGNYTKQTDVQSTVQNAIDEYQRAYDALYDSSGNVLDGLSDQQIQGLQSELKKARQDLVSIGTEVQAWLDDYAFQNDLTDQYTIKANEKLNIIDETLNPYLTKQEKFDALMELYPDIQKKLYDLSIQGELTENILNDEDYNEFVEHMNSVGLTVKDVTDQINALSSSVKGQVVDPQFNISDWSDGIDSIQSSIGTYETVLDALNEGTFGYSDYIDLIQQFPELAEGVDTTSDSFSGLAKNLKRAIKESPKDLVKDLKALREQMKGAGKDVSGIDAIIKSCEQLPTDKVETLADKYYTLSDAINASTKAQNELDEAMNVNNNSGFESTAEAVQEMSDLVEQGLVGSMSNLWDLVKAIYGEESSIYKNMDVEALKADLEKKQVFYDMGEDNDNEYNVDAVQKYIQAVEDAVSESKELQDLMIWDWDAENKQLSFDFD